MDRTSSSNGLAAYVPKVVEGPYRRTIDTLQSIVGASIAAAKQNRAHTKEGDFSQSENRVHPAQIVFASLLPSVSPPFSPKLFAKSQSDGKYYAFSNPLVRDANHLPSLIAAIEAFEASEDSLSSTSTHHPVAGHIDNVHIGIDAALATTKPSGKADPNVNDSHDELDTTLSSPPPLHRAASSTSSTDTHAHHQTKGLSQANCASGSLGDFCERILPFVSLAASQYFQLFGEEGSSSSSTKDNRVEGVANEEFITDVLTEVSAQTPADHPSRVVALSKAQALSIVACSFLCLFPRIAYRGGGAVPCLVPTSDDDDVGSEDCDNAELKEECPLSSPPIPKGEEAMVALGPLPTINCEELFSASCDTTTVEVAKLQMMLIYFSEMERRYRRGFGFGGGGSSLTNGKRSNAEKGKPTGACKFAADHTGPSLFFVRHELPLGKYFFDKQCQTNVSPDAPTTTTIGSSQTTSTSAGASATQETSTQNNSDSVSSPLDEGNECWEGCGVLLSPLVLAPLKESIDDQQDVLRIDFANMTIGGGAMSYGCVQEEITFALCPELIASRLMMADMGDREAIVLLGAEQFALLEEGTYGFSMACGGQVPHPDEMLVASCSSAIVAVDALDYRGTGRRNGQASQYLMKSITREMIKLAAGLAIVELDTYSQRLVSHKRAMVGASMIDSLCPAGARLCGEGEGHSCLAGDKSVVATGNWGCGVFLGDVEIKSLLQWLVCSELGKVMHYYPFDNPRLEVLEFLAPQLCAKKVTTQRLSDFFGTLRKACFQYQRRGEPFSVFSLMAAHFGLDMPVVPDKTTPSYESGSETETEADTP